MFWDGLIILVAVILAVNGWSRGLINSWRGPIAMVAATLIVQNFYIDFSTWIMSRLRLSPENAVFVGYLMLWFSIDAVLEIALALLLRLNRKERPIFFDRLGGVIYGLFKACVIVLLPVMATSVDIAIPEPPPDRSGIQLPVPDVEAGTLLLPGVRQVASSLVPIVGNFVVSTKPPSFTPVYDTAKKQPDEESPQREGVPRKDIEDLLKP